MGFWFNRVIYKIITKWQLYMMICLTSPWSRYIVAFVKICLAAFNVERNLLSLLHWHVVSCIWTNIVLSRSDYLVFRIVQKFIPMSQPSCHSGDHEKHWEHVSREAHSFINDSTIEIYIGIKLSLNKVGITKCYSFKFNCNLNEFFFTCNSEDLVSNFFNDFCTRIVVFIYSVSKAIKKSFFLLYTFDEFGDILLFTNWFEHS